MIVRFLWLMFVIFVATAQNLCAMETKPIGKVVAKLERKLIPYLEKNAHRIEDLADKFKEIQILRNRQEELIEYLHETTDWNDEVLAAIGGEAAVLCRRPHQKCYHALNLVASNKKILLLLMGACFLSGMQAVINDDQERVAMHILAYTGLLFLDLATLQNMKDRLLYVVVGILLIYSSSKTENAQALLECCGGPQN